METVKKGESTMKVHFIKMEHLYDLEPKINEWIESHRNVEIIDIKYSIGPWQYCAEYSVMIIYR